MLRTCSASASLTDILRVAIRHALGTATGSNRQISRGAVALGQRPLACSARMYGEPSPDEAKRHGARLPVGVQQTQEAAGSLLPLRPQIIQKSHRIPRRNLDAVKPSLQLFEQAEFGHRRAFCGQLSRRIWRILPAAVPRAPHRSAAPPAIAAQSPTGRRRDSPTAQPDHPEIPGSRGAGRDYPCRPDGR